MDGDDVGMVERRNRLRFTLESCSTLGTAGHLEWQDLERHLPVELGVLGDVDFSHAAFAEQGDDRVMAELGARWECHRIVAPYGRPRALKHNETTQLRQCFAGPLRWRAVCDWGQA
jgi:hypothetical protein